MNDFWEGQYVKEFSGGPILEILRIYTDNEDDVECAEVAERDSQVNENHEYLDTYNISLESLMTLDDGDLDL